MKYYMLFYKTIENYVEQRIPFRGKHIELAQDYYNRGLLLMGGTLEEPSDSAVLVFRVNSESEVKKFVESDPYVNNGLVKEWSIRPWKVVIGSN